VTWLLQAKVFVRWAGRYPVHRPSAKEPASDAWPPWIYTADNVQQVEALYRRLMDAYDEEEAKCAS
jgi:hypothetical protein